MPFLRVDAYEGRSKEQVKELLDDESVGYGLALEGISAADVARKMTVRIIDPYAGDPGPLGIGERDCNEVILSLSR
jgi:hypothetical protein